MLLVENTTSTQKTLKSLDGDEVIIQPNTKTKVEDKFNWQLNEHRTDVRLVMPRRRATKSDLGTTTTKSVGTTVKTKTETKNTGSVYTPQKDNGKRSKYSDLNN